MNKEQTAIANTVVQWTKLAETGEDKPNLGIWNNCHFCENFRDRNTFSCDKCPYFKKYGHCYSNNMPFNLWRDTKNLADKRIHAAAFLAQVEILQENVMIEIDGVEISTETARAALKAYGVKLEKPEPEKPKLRHGDVIKWIGDKATNKGTNIIYQRKSENSLSQFNIDTETFGVTSEIPPANQPYTKYFNLADDLKAIKPLKEFELDDLKVRLDSDGELRIVDMEDSETVLIKPNDIHDFILKLRGMELQMLDAKK